MADAEFTREFGFGETEEQLIRYLEEVGEFRDLYLEKMGSLGLSDTPGWAYFELEEADWPEGAWTDVCLWHANTVLPDTPNQKTAFQIRLLSAEGYLVDGRPAYLTTDVTVDGKDDVAYMVGTSSMEYVRVIEDYVPDLDGDDQDDEIITSVPYFYVKEGKLLLAPQHHIDHTRTFSITYTCSSENGQDVDSRYVLPFGGYDRLADKVHALSVAQRLLGLVTDYQPRAQAAIE